MILQTPKAGIENILNIRENQLKIGVILSYVSTGANMVIQLLYTPVMIRLLGQSEYGLYTLVGSVVSYLSLFSLGFGGAYLRFYSRYHIANDQKAIARLNGMFLTLFFCMSAAVLLCGFILAQFTSQLFGSKLSAAEIAKAKMLMQILVFNIALTFPASIFDSIVSAHEQFFFQRFLQLAGVLFNPLLCLPLLLMGYGSIAIVLVTTFITISKLAVNVFFCVRKLHTPFYFHDFDWKLLREIANFSFFLFLNMIIDQINWSVDKFILGRVSGTTAVAIYGVGAQINALYLSFSTAISSVFAPRVNQIAAAFPQDIGQKITPLFIKVGRIQFLVLGLILSGFTVFGEYFITEIFAGHAYAQAYPTALLLIFPVTIALTQNMGIEVQRAVNKHQFRSVIYLMIAVLNIILSIPLAKRYGPVGSAIGTMISLLLGNGLIMNLYYWKALKIDIPAFWKSMLQMCKGLFLPVLMGAAILHFVEFSHIGVFLLYIILYTGIYIFSFWLFGMNREEKLLLVKPIRSLLRLK